MCVHIYIYIYICIHTYIWTSFIYVYIHCCAALAQAFMANSNSSCGDLYTTSPTDSKLTTREFSKRILPEGCSFSNSRDPVCVFPTSFQTAFACLNTVGEIVI